MSDVTPIGAQGVTPEVIAHEFMKTAGNMRSCFIVAFDHQGEVVLHLAGTRCELAYAGAILQREAIKGF